LSDGLAVRLSAAADTLTDERVPLRTLADAHGAAAQGSLLVLLAVPCVLPVAGVGTVLGLGLIALAWAIWRGDATCALPARVAALTLSREAARNVLRRLAQVHAAAAKLSRERLPHLAGPGMRAWLGAKAGLMALLIVLPIPFGNLLPALSLLLLGLGLAFRDGLAVLLSTAVATLAVAFTGGLGWLVWQHGPDVLGRLVAMVWPV
jgi:hypothetical protein